MCVVMCVVMYVCVYVSKIHDYRVGYNTMYKCLYYNKLTKITQTTLA